MDEKLNLSNNLPDRKETTDSQLLKPEEKVPVVNNRGTGDDVLDPEAEQNKKSNGTNDKIKDDSSGKDVLDPEDEKKKTKKRKKDDNSDNKDNQEGQDKNGDPNNGDQSDVGSGKDSEGLADNSSTNTGNGTEKLGGNTPGGAQSSAPPTSAPMEPTMPTQSASTPPAPAGSATGGTVAGGSATGGTVAGGSATGGTVAGGSAAGGTVAGGSVAGGTVVGGSAAGGTAAGGAVGLFANPVGAFILIVIVVIIILIGVIAFFQNMPGLMVGKLKQFAQGLWDGVESIFTTDADAFMNDDDVTNLAQYLVDMDYDLIGYGFIRAKEVGEEPTFLELEEDGYYINSDGQYVTLDSDGNEVIYKGEYYNALGYLVDNEVIAEVEEEGWFVADDLVKDKYGIKYWAADGENAGKSHVRGQIAEIYDRDTIELKSKANGDDSLLRAYLMADYRITVLRNDDEGVLKEVGLYFDRIFGGATNAWSKGLIKLYKVDDDGVGKLWDGITTLWWNNATITDSGTKLSLRAEYFNRPMEFELDGWTGRYGLSLEFLLSLHLGTMAPDLVTAMLQCFDTEVQVYCEKITDAKVLTKYKDYKVDDFENHLADNDEEVTIEKLNQIINESPEDYVFDIADGALIEWANGLTLTKKKCYTLLRESGLSSPPGCVYKAVSYVILKMQSRYGEWFEDQNCNYLSYYYNVEDPLLEEVEYRVKEDTDAYYTAKNSLYSLRLNEGLGYTVDPTVTSVITDGITTHVEAGREEVKNIAKGFGLPDNIEPLIEDGYTGDGTTTKKIGDKEIIGNDNYVYRIERNVEIVEWPIYGYLDGNNEFQQVSEEAFNADETETYEETTGYYNSFIYKIYQTGIIDDATGNVIYYKDGEVTINDEEDPRGTLVHKFTLEFYKASEEEVIGEHSFTIYYNPNKEGTEIEKFDCYDETGANQNIVFLANTVSNFSAQLDVPIEYECICGLGHEKHTDRYYFKLTIEESTDGQSYTFTIEPDPNSETNTNAGAVYSAWRYLNDNNQATYNIDTIKQGNGTIISDEYLYDVLYMNFVVRDKTLEELVLCGLLKKENGIYIPVEEAGECSTDTELERCCSVCQRYVKSVIKGLAQIQDKDYAYYQPYIARVVGSWFRDTYFIIPEEEDLGISDYKAEHPEWNSNGSYGEDGLYVKVDEEYLNSTGEYWTDYVMKTETLEDGTVIETDEYQLFYMNPDGTTSTQTLEEWLASDENLNSKGEKYISRKEAEEDGHVFVKKVKLLSIQDIQNNTSSEEGGGRESSYMNDRMVWSAYSTGEGGDSGWIKINRGEVDNVDKVLDIVDDQGEFYYRLETTKTIEQEEDAIRTETNVTVKNLFKYRQFYIYDGSRSRAELIQKDREKTNRLIQDYWATAGTGYSKDEAIKDLGDHGRYALRTAYNLESGGLIEDFSLLITTDLNQISEAWLEWQLDMYYTANFEQEILDNELFRLDELCDFGVKNKYSNEKFEEVTYLDVDYYTAENHTLDPRDNGLISTVNITKSSLDAFAILENVNTLDADYQYRDFKELIVELNYFDKEELSESVEEVFTWIVPSYTTLWPIQAIDKQNNEYGTLVHSQASIDFLIEVYEYIVEKQQSGEETDSSEEETETEDEVVAETENEQILMQLKEAASYAENSPVISPVTGKIVSFGEHSRINIYTNEEEIVGYVKIEIMGYGSGRTASESYFTDAMLSESGLNGDEKEKALKGLNGFYDEYKDNCAGYILTIDGIDITDLKNGFSSVTDTDGNSVEYDDLCEFTPVQGIALYNSKEQKKREEIEEGKELAPFLIKYNVDYEEVNGEYFATDTLGGYYVKEGAYLGKTQSPTDRNSENVVNPNPDATQGENPNVSDDSVFVEEDPDLIYNPKQIYKKFLDEDKNPDYLRLILLNAEMTNVDNVEDYFPGFEEGDSTTGTKFSGSFSEKGLYWMIVCFEGLRANEVREGFVAIDIGDGTITAGGSGITNWCNNYFWELGYEQYVHYKRGSNVGMEVGDRIPGNVIMDIKAVVIDAHVANVNSTFPDNSFTQEQIEALASVSYNFGHIPERLVNAINSNSNVKEVWEHLSDSQATQYPGLVTRRKAEYRLFSQGIYSNGSGNMYFSTDTPYTDYINGNNTVTYE